MKQPLTILLAGGGTGGHLYPGIAIAEAIRCRVPDARQIFLCTNREIDKVILEPTGFESIHQPIVPPHRSISGLLRFFPSWFETKELVRRVVAERKPAAVIGLGGYAAGVAVKLAAQAGVMTLLLNPDVVPGKANVYLLPYVQSICCQFASSVEAIKPVYRPKIRVTGCPIRRDIRQIPPRPEAAARLGIDPMLKTLVITGASQGAQTVNEAALAVFRNLTMTGWQVLHLSGRDHAQSVRAGYRELQIAARVVDFTPAMADVWSVADLAISRSGASSCAELTACGVPSILMPYPFHKDLHQRKNAAVLVEAGAALLVDDERDAAKNGEKLKAAIEPLLHDGGRRAAMSDAARRISRPDAADAIAKIVIDGVNAAATIPT
jgi:UDP-N-acetylglucosamine--N-acetylmuramyl-(pentapeptide) pyrophosphoryl-undecaprenol N-acetylglucosamine transferase